MRILKSDRSTSTRKAKSTKRKAKKGGAIAAALILGTIMASHASPNLPEKKARKSDKKFTAAQAYDQMTADGNNVQMGKMAGRIEGSYNLGIPTRT